MKLTLATLAFAFSICAEGRPTQSNVAPSWREVYAKVTKVGTPYSVSEGKKVPGAIISDGYKPFTYSGQFIGNARASTNLETLLISLTFKVRFVLQIELGNYSVRIISRREKNFRILPNVWLQILDYENIIRRLKLRKLIRSEM